MARRAVPKELWSDNATCFKAAEKELAKAALAAVSEEATARRITCRYVPPASPFMDSAWERMVRTVKEALRVKLHEQYPSDETLLTLLAEAENTVNSHPLTHVAVTPEEPEALTPNHILLGPKRPHRAQAQRWEPHTTSARYRRPGTRLRPHPAPQHMADRKDRRGLPRARRRGEDRGRRNQQRACPPETDQEDRRATGWIAELRRREKCARQNLN